MNVNVNISKEAIEYGVSVLSDILSVSNSSEEKSSGALNDQARSSFEKARNLLESGDVDGAIYELKNSISEEPSYARGRIVILHAYRKKGWDGLALFMGGVAYRDASTPESKAMAASMAAKVLSDAYETNPSDALGEQAIELYTAAISAYPSDVVARWNRLQMVSSLGNADTLGYELQGIVNILNDEPGVWSGEARFMLNDWDEVIGDRPELEMYRSAIVSASTVEPIKDDKKEATSTWRSVLQVVVLACMLSGSPAYLAEATVPAPDVEQTDDSATSDEIIEARVHKERDQTTDASQIEPNVMFEASIEYDSDKLWKLAGGIEYDDKKIFG